MKQTIKGLLTSILILILLVTTVYAASVDWVFSIKFDDTKTLVVKPQDFLNDYNSYLLLQSELSGLDESVVKRLLTNKEKQKEYFDLMLNHTLVLDFVKSRNTINMQEVDKKVKNIAQTIKKMLIVKEFIRKVIDPQVKPATSDEVKEFYNRYRNNPEFKERVRGLNTAQINDAVQQILQSRQKQALLQKYLTRLRERVIINVNEEFFK